MLGLFLGSFKITQKINILRFIYLLNKFDFIHKKNKQKFINKRYRDIL